MKSIKLYFAASWAGGSPKGELKVWQAGVRNKLTSFAYPPQFEGWYDCMNKASEETGSVMIDSGAFSAWNKAKKIDLDEYIDYVHRVQDRMASLSNQTLHIVNLDVIPGIVGQTLALSRIRKTENTDLIELAAKQGFRNMKRMLERSITPIHVFHQGEDFKWLDRMLEHVPYIGISPANDLASSTRNAWMEIVFEYLYKQNAQVDTHGFAVTSQPVLQKLPWTSCDAATWRISAGMGYIYLQEGGFSNPKFSGSPLVLNVSTRKFAEGLENLTPAKTEWVTKETGYTFEELQKWENRVFVNIRYFLELEKWLNEQKQNRSYTPRTNFGFY